MYLRDTRTREKRTKYIEQQEMLRTYLGPGEKELALVQPSYELSTDHSSMYLFT